MYFLVLLREDFDASAIDHESFVDSLIERNLVLLGGPFVGEPYPGVTAAYVLRCADADEAAAIVATDPLVTSGTCVSTVVGWDLVGIDLAAIDPELTV